MIAAAVAAPAPSPLKTFTDWTVGCDNGRACQADGLVPESDSDGLTMVVARDAAANARPTLFINMAELKVAAFTADGRKLVIRPISADAKTSIRAEDALTFIDAIKPAKRLGLLNARGAEIGHVSLAGFSAALLYMDDQQKRVGTVTALIRKGAPTVVPAPHALPVIVSPVASKLPPLKLGKADIDREIKSFECEAGESTAFDPTYVRLDARTTLALVPLPCGNGAYNYLTKI